MGEGGGYQYTFWGKQLCHILSPFSSLNRGQLLKERICSIGVKLCAKCRRQSLKMILLKLENTVMRLPYAVPKK